MKEKELRKKEKEQGLPEPSSIPLPPPLPKDPNLITITLPKEELFALIRVAQEKLAPLIPLGAAVNTITKQLEGGKP